MEPLYGPGVRQAPISPACQPLICSIGTSRRYPCFCQCPHNKASSSPRDKKCRWLSRDEQSHQSSSTVCDLRQFGSGKHHARLMQEHRRLFPQYLSPGSVSGRRPGYLARRTDGQIEYADFPETGTRCLELTSCWVARSSVSKKSQILGKYRSSHTSNCETIRSIMIPESVS